MNINGFMMNASELDNGCELAATGAQEEQQGIEPQQLCKLENFCHMSNSHLWKLMTSFYERKGIDSWSHGIVPHFITSNAFIGRAYAEVFRVFLCDCALNPKPGMELDPNAPIYIIELGSGCGKFGFFMLKALKELNSMLPIPFANRVVYVMTDFTDRMLKFWREHPALQSYIENGRLDMAVFDANADVEMHLAISGEILSPRSTTSNPVCIIANYLFDTLCHDAFQIHQGVLMDGLVSVGSTRPEEPDPLDPEIIKRIRNVFMYRPTKVSDCYVGKDDRDEAFYYQKVLNWYIDYFGDSTSNGGNASIIFPIGPLRALRRLVALGDRRALVISGDKGSNNPEQFRGIMDPHFAYHGSFSVMVNYHAIGAYFTAQGGVSLHNPQEDASIKVSAFVLSGGVDDTDTDITGESLEVINEERISLFPHLNAAFRNHIILFGPSDFFALQKGINEESPSLKTVVSLLKLSDWDADVFYKFRDILLQEGPKSGLKTHSDICRDMPRVLGNYFMLGHEKDVPFEIGRLFYGIQNHSEALTYYQSSKKLIGAHHVTSFNMGLCYYSLGNLQRALEYFNEASDLCPEYQKAKSWQEKVLKTINLDPIPPKLLP
eukprot:30121_1